MSKPKILVVDDVTSIRELLRRVLETFGYDVVTASSGDEAVLLLSPGFDIVLTDISMPGVASGIDVLKKARAVGNIDVIMMTGFPELDVTIGALREGAYDFLIKPISLDAIQAAVTRCMHKRELSAELIREKALRSELEFAYSELQKAERLKRTFGQFVTPEVMNEILKEGEDFMHRGRQCVVTMLFSDVRGFTNFARKHDPVKVVEDLNQLHEIVIGCVGNQHGTLNKFMGDGLLALFGAPRPMEDHASAAVRAAVEAQQRIDEYAQKRKEAGEEVLQVGIGISTGEVVAGCIGTTSRTEYSVIGHAVNLASRLEGAARPGQILISGDTSELINGSFNLRRMRNTRLRGIGSLSNIREVVWK
ncbi:MAG: response regulator [Planctomycetes bacterium]|nr:response regulator [Planctomycetota bacterium]